MRLFLPVLVAMLLLTGCDRDPDPTVRVTGYGIYDATVTTSGDWAKKTPVRISSVTGLKLKQETTRIPCSDKVYFGWHCRVTNYWDEALIVTSTISHPAIDYPDGTSTQQEPPAERVIAPHTSADVESMWFFLDSCPHEYVPGPWIFRLEINGKPAAQKEFEVYKP